jgi:hypothetical protein
MNVGGWFEAFGANSLFNYGIYASYPYPQYSNANNCAAYLDGEGFTSIGIFAASDIKLKQNIQTSINNLSVIKKLKPVSYEFRKKEFPNINLPEGINTGLIANELQTLIPSLVKEFTHPAKKDTINNIIYPELTFKGVNYSGLIPYLIGAIQEQQTQIENLDSVIQKQNQELDNRFQSIEGRLNRVQSNTEQFNARIANCCDASTSSSPNSVSVILSETNQNYTSSASESPLLMQNEPNPFSQSTLIKYYLPQETSEAQLRVVNSLGEEVRLFNLSGIGYGRITIQANSLAPGNYLYSLTINGRPILSRSMILTP